MPMYLIFINYLPNHILSKHWKPTEGNNLSESNIKNLPNGIYRSNSQLSKIFKVTLAKASDFRN